MWLLCVEPTFFRYVKKVLRNSHYQNELKAPQGRLDVTLNLNFIARVNCLHFLNIVFRSHITHIFFSFWRFVTIGYFSHHTICSTRATTERNWTRYENALRIYMVNITLLLTTVLVYWHWMKYCCRRNFLLSIYEWKWQRSRSTCDDVEVMQLGLLKSKRYALEIT